MSVPEAILRGWSGNGSTDQFLLPKERNVKVVELDYGQLWPTYGKPIRNWKNNIIEDDFLKMNLQRLFGGQPFVLTGNYPYNISARYSSKCWNIRI